MKVNLISAPPVNKIQIYLIFIKTNAFRNVQKYIMEIPMTICVSYARVLVWNVLVKINVQNVTFKAILNICTIILVIKNANKEPHQLLISNVLIAHKIV